MSIHMSVQRGSVSEEGCIDSLGRYQPPGTKKQWNITAPRAFAALCASLANLARGYVLGYSSPSIPELRNKGLLTNDDEASWYGSFVAIGSLFGALAGGVITHRLGRKLSTMITCIPLAFGWLSIICADSIWWLYLGRILTGMGNGMSSLVTSVYVTEVSSSNARGMLGTINQIAASVGVFIVYVLPFGMDYQWLAVVGAINAAVTMLLMTFMPETPRWLISKGRTTEAIENFMWIRGCDKETAQMVVLKLEEEMMKQKTSFGLKELLLPEVFKPFIIAQLSMFFQQFTGLFVLLFYTQSIFEMVGFSGGAKSATAVMGAVTVGAYLFTPLLVERTGRRIMLNISAAGVLVSATVLGACFYIHDRDAHHINGTQGFAATTVPPVKSAVVSYVALAASLCYMASYSLGYGPLPWVLISELIPLKARATVGGIAVFLTWLLSFAVTKIFAPLSDLIGTAGCFWIFAGFSILALIYVATLLPETKGRSLEEIEAYFIDGEFPDKYGRRAVRVTSATRPASSASTTRPASSASTTRPV